MSMKRCLFQYPIYISLPCFILQESDYNDVSNDHLESEDEFQRDKRSPRGKFRGQTQSQYMSFSDKEDGKAEAEATLDTSRSTVGKCKRFSSAQHNLENKFCSWS